MRAVMDTNVLVTALRSHRGASYELLRLLRQGEWTLVLSNTVLGEYHDVLHRESAGISLSHTEIDSYLDALCALAEQRTLGGYSQPVAADPDDEPLVQLARQAGVLYLITYNVRDVQGATQFGVRVLRPAEFLDLLRKAV